MNQYIDLAQELMKKMFLLRGAGPPKNLSQAMKGEIFMIHYITRNNGSAIPGDISREMGVSSARVAAALNNLEQKGWITRRIDPHDRRRILVELTQQGQEASRQHEQAVIQDMARVLAALGEKDAREFIRIMGRLGQLMGQDDCSGPS